MATLNRIIETIARFDHRGRAATRRLGYALAGAGHVRVGSRGGRLIDLDTESAANLLLGIACGEPPAGVARVVQAFGAAKARPHNWCAHGIDGCEGFDAIADAGTLHEALVTALDVAPEIVFLAEARARKLHPRSAEAAFDAAIRGMVLDLRVALMRPQGVAALRLVDGTDERGAKNLAVIWFEADPIDPLPRGGNAVTVTHEFGLNLLGPVAFELRDRVENRTRLAALSAPVASGAAVAFANTGAAPVGSIQSEQRRETVRAATRSGVASDGN